MTRAKMRAKKKGSTWNGQARERGAVARIAASIPNRIVGEGWEKPEALKANPANWRTHAPEQREAMREMMESVGWVQRVIVNRKTGHVVDGHMRIEEAIRKKEPRVPVVYVELTEAEERRVLALFDPVATMAGIDKSRLREVLADLRGDSIGLTKLISGLREKAGVDDGAADEPPEVEFTEELLEEHNYVVLYFDNSVDWLYLQSLYPLADVKSLRSEGKFQQIGQGRVVRGVDFLHKVRGET